MDGVSIRALNIVLEYFDHALPSHSHGNGCYEIHYIPSGYGMLTADSHPFHIRPNTLFVTGPHVEHTQVPQAEEPMQEYCVYLKIKENAKRKESCPVMDSFLSTPFWFGADTPGASTPSLHLLTDELERRHIGYLDQARLLLSQLLIYIVRNYKNARPKLRCPEPGRPLPELTSVIHRKE